MIQFLNRTIPEKMVVKNLLSGRSEVLTFNEERFSDAGYAGYVPDEADQSGILGLFWLTDTSLRLIDKVGSEFQFDPSGRLTDMILAEDYIVSYKYGYKISEVQEFHKPPFRVEPLGEERVSVLNVTLPRNMGLIDSRGRLRETFRFDEDNEYGLIGYSPTSGSNSHYRFLSLFTDGSFQLEDKSDWLIKFNGGGEFEIIQAPVIKSVSQGDYKVVFDYEYYGDEYKIKTARVMTEGKDEPLYASHYMYRSDGKLSTVRLASGKKVSIKYGNNTVRIASK